MSTNWTQFQTVDELCLFQVMYIMGQRHYMTCRQYLSLQYVSVGCIPLFVVCFLTFVTTLDAAALNRTDPVLPADQLRPNDVKEDANKSDLVSSLSGFQDALLPLLDEYYVNTSASFSCLRCSVFASIALDLMSTISTDFASSYGWCVEHEPAGSSSAC